MNKFQLIGYIFWIITISSLLMLEQIFERFERRIATIGYLFIVFITMLVNYYAISHSEKDDL